MTKTPTSPSPEDLALLSQILREVARSRRLSREDAQDFIQTAQVKLLERGYDVLQRFTGRSSLRTYLTVVVTRLLLDWRNSVYGKWRPSTAALRLGEPAIELERLISRDGHTRTEAIAVLQARPDGPSRDDLLQLAERLPCRPRRRMVSDETLAEAGVSCFEDPLAAAEQRQAAGQIITALAIALRQLPPEEQWLIRVRYAQNRSVQALAASLKTDPKRLYRRFDRTLRRLRHMLVAAGVTGAAVTGALAASRQP